MLFTREGLEQSTHETVAAYHASRYPKGEVVADLTCGIGADLIALASRGPAIGFDTDAETARCAAHNLKVHGLAGNVTNCDAMAFDWKFDYAFADPSRRIGSTRSVDPTTFSPSPNDLASRLSKLRFAGMKLSPMLRDDYLADMSEEIEFISFAGECREALAWFGEGTTAGVYARRIESGERLKRADSQTHSSTDVPLEYLFEADPAAIRAHCLGALCEELNAVELGDSNGYLTGSKQFESSWARTYRILEHGSFDEKRVRTILKKMGGGVPIIKSRAPGVDGASLSKHLVSKGTKATTVALYAIGKSTRFLIVENVLQSK